MPKFKLSVLISAICLMGVLVYGLVAASQSPQPTVRLLTDPPISQVLPFEAEAATRLGSKQPQSPVRLTLQAVDADGQPLENAKIRLQILTPPPNPWFPTDFPMVEGTKLLEIEANAPQGELQAQQILPIRGTYQLLVNVTPVVANTFTPIQQTLRLTVAENPLKYRNLGILAVILLIVGLGGGLVIGGSQQIQSGEIAPQRVRLLLSGATIVAIAALLVVNVNAEITESSPTHRHPGEHEHYSEANIPAFLQSQELKLELIGDSHAIVGKPAQLSVQVRNSMTGQPVTNVLLKIKAMQLENHWVAFAYHGAPDVEGRLSWQEQFFDGAPHLVEVEAVPESSSFHQFKPFQLSREIDVEGVAPPLAVRIIGLAYFVSIVLAGLVLGLWLRWRWTWQ